MYEPIIIISNSALKETYYLPLRVLEKEGFNRLEINGVSLRFSLKEIEVNNIIYNRVILEYNYRTENYLLSIPYPELRKGISRISIGGRKKPVNIILKDIENPFLLSK